MGIVSAFTFINMIIFIALFAVGIYCLILFIKLLKKAIEALDIYIEEKKNKL